MKVVCDVKINDNVTRISCVAEVSYNFEMPPFLPFTKGCVILDLMECPAERRMSAI